MIKMLKRRLMEIMNGEQSHPLFSPATFLWGISQAYSAVVRLRRWGYEKGLMPTCQLPCPVISVGNIAIGGTGKTPMVVHLARLIEGMGRRVAVISAGYKGTAYKGGGTIVSDGRSLACNARQSGDEPYLVATLLGNIPVVVGKDRWSAGKMALDQFDPEILLLDDAYQHLRLKRDLNLLLLDARRPFGNSYLLPRGRLREPASVLSKADAIVLTRSEKYTSNNSNPIAGIQCRIPVFRSEHSVVVRGVAPARKPLPPLSTLPDRAPSLIGRQVFGFAGLAHNHSFFDGLGHLGCSVKGSLGFDDHHNYHEGDIHRIVQAATASGVGHLVTTDKDYVRFSNHVRFPMDLIVMGVDIDLKEDLDPWSQFIKESVGSFFHKNKVIK
jgi:tetraacyldisaccharide 4'-kinase